MKKEIAEERMQNMKNAYLKLDKALMSIDHLAFS